MLRLVEVLALLRDNFFVDAIHRLRNRHDAGWTINVRQRLRFVVFEVPGVGQTPNAGGVEDRAIDVHGVVGKALRQRVK